MAKDYSAFNRFQSDFYTNSFAFSNYSDFEKKNNIFTILDNITKGLPHFTHTYINLYSPHVKTLESPAIIDALHKNFCNDFSDKRIPKFIYFKTSKAKKATEPKVRKKKGDLMIIEFEPEIISQIQTALMLDSKTYEYLKHTPKVQKIGEEIMKKVWILKELKFVVSKNK